MTLRKITIDNSEKYIHSANAPAIESSHKTKPNTRKKITSKDLSQKNKKLLKKITTEGVRTIK